MWVHKDMKKPKNTLVRLTGLAYIFMLILNILIAVFCGPIVGFFNLSAEATSTGRTDHALAQPVLCGPLANSIYDAKWSACCKRCEVYHDRFCSLHVDLPYLHELRFWNRVRHGRPGYMVCNVPLTGYSASFSLSFVSNPTNGSTVNCSKNFLHKDN